MAANLFEGSISEAVATAWLQSQGYVVFNNIGYHGEENLVATKGRRVLRIDVKTIFRTVTDGKRYFSACCPSKRSDSQKRNGIVYLHVFQENGVLRKCTFDDLDMNKWLKDNGYNESEREPKDPIQVRYNGESVTLNKLSKLTGVLESTLHSRYRKGVRGRRLWRKVK